MSQDDEADGLPPFLNDPSGVLQRRWPWLAGVAAAGLIATAIYVSLMPVTFLATATLVFYSQEISDRFVGETGEDPMSQLDALLSGILTRDQLEQLVQDHKLYPELRAKTPLIALAGMARNNVIFAPAGSVVPNGRGSASVFKISFRDRDPAVAAAMANDLAKLFTTAARKSRADAASTTANFMKNELVRSQEKLIAQEKAISDFKTAHRGELPTELGTNTSKLDRIALERQTLATQLDAAVTRLADLEKLGDLANPSSPYSRLSALRSKLVSELAANTEEHPNVIALRRQIEALEKEVAAGAKPTGDPAEDNALRDARKQVADLREQIEKRDREAAQLEEKVSKTPQSEETLNGLTQKQSVLYDTYISNLRKLEAAELALNVESQRQGSRVDVQEPAAAPSEPERTRLKYLLAGLAAAILGAVAVAVLLELIDPVIVSAQQIEDELRLRVLGSVGRIV